MRSIMTSIGLATMMIGAALMAANGQITKEAFDVMLYGLIAATVVATGTAPCRRKAA